MTILDLLEKYESNDSINFLKEQFGSLEYIMDLFSSTMGIKNVIENRNLDYRFYLIFHNIYTKVEGEKTIDNTTLNCLIILESYYTIYSKSRVKNDEINNSKKLYSAKELKTKINNNLLNMYNINNLPQDYKYYSLAHLINQDINNFSLSEIFNDDTVIHEKKGFNAVSIITRNQTISRFNDTKFDNIKGSGYHDTNFEEILRTVYGRSFENNTNGQDIKIRYTTLRKKDGSISCTMLLDIPLIINSSQLISLNNLNDEIKLLEESTGQEIYVLSNIIDYKFRTQAKNYIDQINLDKALNSVIVDDNLNDEYQEICFVGYSNLENHYNIAQYTR